MEEVKFKIGSEQFVIKQTFRALLLFEEMNDREYNDTKLNDQFKMLFCLLKAANKETFKYSFDDFLTILDDNQDSVQKFFEYLNSLAANNKPQVTKKKQLKKQ
jgi:hypothetical protein